MHDWSAFAQLTANLSFIVSWCLDGPQISVLQDYFGRGAAKKIFKEIIKCNFFSSIEVDIPNYVFEHRFEFDVKKIVKELILRECWRVFPKCFSLQHCARHCKQWPCWQQMIVKEDQAKIKNTSGSGCGNNTLQFVCHCQTRGSVVLMVWHLRGVFQTCFDSSTILTAVFKPHFQSVSLKWAVCEKLKWWNTFQFIRSLEMADWRHYLVLFAWVPGVRKKEHHNRCAFKTTGCAQSEHNKRHMSNCLDLLHAMMHWLQKY